MDEREATYWALHDGVPSAWHLTRASSHGEEGLWHINAVDLRCCGRGVMHQATTRTGATELEAVKALR